MEYKTIRVSVETWKILKQKTIECQLNIEDVILDLLNNNEVKKCL